MLYALFAALAALATAAEPQLSIPAPRSPMKIFMPAKVPSMQERAARRRALKSESLEVISYDHPAVPTEHLCTEATCGFDAPYFQASTIITEGSNAFAPKIYMYWSLNDDESEIDITIDAHNAPGYVYVGLRRVALAASSAAT